MNLPRVIQTISIVLVIAGALNWGLVGAFQFNAVVALFGTTAYTQFIYILIGLAGLSRIFWIAKNK